MMIIVDLKAAFDSVDNRGIDKDDEKKGNMRGTDRESGGSIERKKNRVKVDGKLGKGFWTARLPVEPLVVQYSVSEY